MNSLNQEEQETSVRAERFLSSHEMLYHTGLVGEHWAKRKVDKI
jgi:hypothetical protein